MYMYAYVYVYEYVFAYVCMHTDPIPVILLDPNSKMVLSIRKYFIC